MANETEIVGKFPAINASGIFKVREPFKNRVIDGEVYTCTGIDLLSVVNKEIDLYTQYYLMNNISENKYKEDLANQEALITLEDTNGDIVKIMSSYISSFPTSNGLNYFSVGLLFNIGPWHEGSNFYQIINVCKDAISDTLGLKKNSVSAHVAKLSNVENITMETHQSIISSRNREKKLSETDNAKSIRLQKDLNSATKKIEELNKIIIKLSTKK